MSRLKQIVSGVSKQPPRILIYSEPGVGKSYFAAGCPKPIFLPTEDGLGQIDCESFPLAKKIDDVAESLGELLTEDHEYRTVVIDTVDHWQNLVFREMCIAEKAESIDDIGGGFGKGAKRAIKHVDTLTTLLDALRSGKRMMVVLLAHSKVEHFSDPTGPAYDRFTPNLQRDFAARFFDWSDVVGFAAKRYVAHEQKAAFGAKRTIPKAVGQGGGERYLQLAGGPTAVSKSRYKVPDEIQLSWPHLSAAIFGVPPATAGQRDGKPSKAPAKSLV